ncbi:Chromatin-remodeling complex ATPase chain isw-1 [Leucoagaricus sp. SymC.cos]|nr:Chromatin-remodeling complex ATPase chain isw-1 [Leucoagaricus sp. SymC.cos]
MGRLVGIPHFLSEVAWVEEKNDASRLRKAKKLDDDGDAVQAENLQVVRRLQNHCIGHFLRRTTGSVDWQGRVLIPLPEYKEIIGVINLTERETKIIEQRSQSAKAAIFSASTAARIHTKKFYLEYRLAVGFAKDDVDDPLPTIKSLEEWEPIKSTKMDVCARVCAHYLSRDDVLDVEFVNGEPIFPATPTSEDTEILKTRRIIIYTEFPSMAPLLTKAGLFHHPFILNGVQSLFINGKISFEQRAKTVKKFENPDSEARVLIFSTVGSAGLNLSIADVVIFFDQPWSAQDERQIRGRAHRQPQSKIVKVIHLLANDSADLLMNDVARGKRDMFNAFVNKELGEGHITEGDIKDIPSMAEDETDSGASTLFNKIRGKKENESDSGASSSITKKKGKGKQRRIIVDDNDEPENGEPSAPRQIETDPISDGATSEGNLSVSSSGRDIVRNYYASNHSAEPETVEEVSEEASKNGTVLGIAMPSSQSAANNEDLSIFGNVDEPIEEPERSTKRDDKSPPQKQQRQGTLSDEMRANLIGESIIDSMAQHSPDQYEAAHRKALRELEEADPPQQDAPTPSAPSGGADIFYLQVCLYTLH